MANSYKSLKEDFVSNLTGGEISEINYVTAVAPAAVVLWSVLQSRQAFFVAYSPLSFTVDFLLNVGAILLSVTLYSSMPLILNALLISPALGLYAVPATTSTRKKSAKPPGKVSSQNNESMEPLAMKPFLTTYRGCMMVITCLAILAVDFRIFPRRFAKVENWGTSLMDLGVGSFVFSAGVVAARSVLKEQAAKQSVPLTKRLYASGRHSLPLIVLGLIRLYSVKGLDYAEHVTEYGVHWNFFFTLAFLPPFVAIFHAAFRLVPSYAVLAILLGVVYQAVLEFTDLKAFILTAPRVDLFSKNREGIFSFFGYLSIFLSGQATGMYILPRFIIPVGPSAGGSAQRKRLLLTLVTWSGVWIVLYNITSNYKFGFGLSVSRRLANLPYVLWVSSFNCVQLTAFCAIETVLFPGFHKATDAKSEKEQYKYATSRVLAAYNRNGLAIFLVANLLTGLVNLTIPTLNVTDIQAMGILLCYAAAVTGFAVVLDLYNISIKL